MATGVQPRESETTLTRSDLEAIQEAMKTKKFRDLLNEYCEELSDPANQKIYQEEMTQLEKERGYDVTFINPKGGYVIKTSVAGDRKAFINICSNEIIEKPSYDVQVQDGQKGMNWKLPYTIVPPREDYNEKREKCVIYDIVFHPDTLRMAHANKRFRELVNKSALDGLRKTYNIHLDSNNCRFPKSYYKGMAVPAVIRKEDPNYVPPTDEEKGCEDFTPEVLEKLYPQHNYSKQNTNEAPKVHKKKSKFNEEFTHFSEGGYTVPKYVIKQQKNIDLQDFTFEKDCKQYVAIPSQIVVHVNLPLLSSTKECTLDVHEKSFYLVSEKPAKYKLNITLPYAVNDDCGNAKFDKTKHMLMVTLPVLKKNDPSTNTNNSSKVDSGVESEGFTGSHSEEETENKHLVEELSSTPAEISNKPAQIEKSIAGAVEAFLDPSLGYTLPSYTHNVLDDVIALTFHVKNTEPDSVKVRSDGNEILIKFSSIGSGFVPVYYAAVIVFDEDIKFENVAGEAWDNNVILQLELASSEIPHKFQIGLAKDCLTNEYFDGSQIRKTLRMDKEKPAIEVEPLPVVEVTNLGTETNIVVSSTNPEYDEDDIESPTAKDDTEWAEPFKTNRAKSILQKPMNMIRSFSESSAGDMASSMDYISSDYIQEESSFKKTVRFNTDIKKQFYRYNSSIEGQKKKNQRKKSKRRNSDRRKSESEAEGDANFPETSKPRLKSVLKPRRDSGLADTSDADTEKNTPSEYEPVFDAKMKEPSDSNDSKSVLNIVDNKRSVGENSNSAIWESADQVKPKAKQESQESYSSAAMKHNTDFYDPEKLNKGYYLEVQFKNDLIFDLDM